MGGKSTLTSLKMKKNQIITHLKSRSIFIINYSKYLHMLSFNYHDNKGEDEK